MTRFYRDRGTPPLRRQSARHRRARARKMGAVPKLRGFILQANYRMVARPGGPRTPVVYLYGRLEEGGTFLVRDDRQRPHFFIRAADAERARELLALEPAVIDR